MKSAAFYPIKENLFKQERLARYNFIGGFVEGGYILEAGCGARDGPLLLSRYAKRVVAIDISEEAINFAKKFFPAENIEYLAMDCLNMKFQKGAFDAVVSLEVIEHLLDVRTYLNNIVDLLKHDGLYLGSTVNKERRGFDPISYKERRHIKEYGPAEYENLLKGYFKDVRIFGQFLKKDIEPGAEELRSMVRRMDLFYLRRLLPSGLKEKVLDFARRRSNATPLSDIRCEDFYFSETNLEEARHLMAVCVK